jgi:hypothetical protein
MNTAPGLEFWWHLAVMLASEMLVIVLIAFAWQTLLGIVGNGFRSGLGRRVDRLLRLNGREWRPLSRIRSSIAKTAGPAVLVAMTLCCCAWMIPARPNPQSEWADSLAGRTLSAISQSIARREATRYVGQQKVGPFPAFKGLSNGASGALDWKNGTDVGPLLTFKTLQSIPLAHTAGQQSPDDVSSKATDKPPLHTRAFKLNPHTLMSLLQNSTPAQPVPLDDLELPLALLPLINADERRLWALRPIDVANSRKEFDALRQFLLVHGVDLAPPKSIFWKDRLAMLMVRATQADLDAIEQALHVINAPPLQVTIEVKIADMPEAAGKQLGLDWLGKTVASTITRNQARNPFVDTNTAVANYATVFTPPQYRVLIKALEEKAGVDLLGMPRVTTLSTRQAQIKVVDIKSVITGVAEKADQSGVFDLVVTQQECGPIIDAVAAVRADGYTIGLTVAVTLREFLGYETTTEVVKVLNDDGTIGSAPKPLPRFRVHQAGAAPTIWDGQTFAMGLGKIEGKERVAFVTVTIIDPAGIECMAKTKVSLGGAGSRRSNSPYFSSLAAGTWAAIFLTSSAGKRIPMIGGDCILNMPMPPPPDRMERITKRPTSLPSGVKAGQPRPVEDVSLPGT